MKIAVIGPGYGHNIEPYLKFLNSSGHIIDFYYHNRSTFESKFDRINFIKLSSSILKLFVSANKYDIIWLMGGGRLIYIVSILKYFIGSKTKLVIFPYSEELPRRTTEQSLNGRITLMALSNFTLIHCGWYGLADLLNVKLKDKILIHPMGLSESYYKTTKSPDLDIFKLIDKVGDDSYNFYYPKSFTMSSRHDLVIEAVYQILSEGNIPKFKVYFIGGNVEVEDRYNQILKMISEYSLQNEIIILNKEKFFKTEDFNLLWNKMDCGLQIAERDGISTTIFEPLINKKELIITDIPPYRYLESHFGFKIKLTSLDTSSIAESMKNKILGINLNNIEKKEKTYNIIRDKYSFEKNIESLLEKFE